MSADPCPADVVLLATARTRRLGRPQPPGAANSDVLTHLETCASCRATVASAQAMQEVAAAPPPTHLPSAAVVLLRARLAARRQAAERALVPLELVHRLTLALSGFALVAVFGWVPSSGASWSAQASGSLLTVLVVVLALGLAALAGWPRWRRWRPTDG